MSVIRSIFFTISFLTFFIASEVSFARQNCNSALSASDLASLDRAFATGTPQAQKLTRLADLVLGQNSARASLQNNPFLILWIFSHFIEKGATSSLKEESEAGLVAYLEATGAEPMDLDALRSTIAAALKDPGTLKAVDLLVRSFSGVNFGNASFYQSEKKPTLLAKSKAWAGQTFGLPKTVISLSQIIAHEMSPAVLDVNLYSFYRFHQEPELPFARQRPWKKVDLSAIDRGQVHGIGVDEFIAILRYAMEIEDPIVGYTFDSGNALKYFQPNISRFMGITEDQAALVNQNGGRNWCQAAWCAEERRHGPILARAIEQLTGVTPDRSNPVKPNLDTPDEKGAIYHHYSRQATEWGAASAYLILAVHSTGPLQDLILNVLRDEIKHLTILSAADILMFGHNPGARLKNMIQKTLYEFKRHGAERSTGGSVGKNLLSITEVLWTLTVVEVHARRYLKHLPIKGLREIFEAPSKAPTPESVTITEEARLADLREIEASEKIRLGLLRWPQQQKISRERLDAFTHLNRELIENLEREHFGSFAGAEVPGSPADEEIQKQIRRFDFRSLEVRSWLPNGPKADLLQQIVLEDLRTYQLFNNYYVRTGDPAIQDQD